MWWIILRLFLFFVVMIFNVVLDLIMLYVLICLLFIWLVMVVFVRLGLILVVIFNIEIGLLKVCWFLLGRVIIGMNCFYSGDIYFVLFVFVFSYKKIFWEWVYEWGYIFFCVWIIMFRFFYVMIKSEIIFCVGFFWCIVVIICSLVCV